MPISRVKDKIYAFVSIIILFLAVASFMAAVNFLLDINNFVFNIDEKIVKERTTVLDKEGFSRIKNKLPISIENEAKTAEASPSP